jgi:arylsulfatase A-like enzyme
MTRNRTRRAALAAAAVALIATVLSVCAAQTRGAAPSTTTPPPPPPPPVGIGQADRWFDNSLPQPAAETGKSAARPNIVFVLTDDLSMNLVPYMPHVQALMQRGMNFTNFTVTDSFCCPSRASTFTGEYPHNTKVFNNVAPRGGYPAFQTNHDGTHTFAVALHAAGYRTAFAGKYLNKYNPVNTAGTGVVPGGWSSWGGENTAGYNEYDYAMALGHHAVSFGEAPADYGTTVLDDLGTSYIRRAPTHHAPFLLELATYAPHSPYVPAPQDADSYPGLTAPRGPAWDQKPANAPGWIANKKPLTASLMKRCDDTFRKRVQDVQSVDRMIGDLEDTLVQTGQFDNTVFVFSSDNGFHTGEYTLSPGKLTAFDTDVHVPLVMAGPGIAPGSTNADLVQNTDLAPTFDALAGAHMPGAPASVDGQSLVPLLHGRSVSWRNAAVVEQWGGAGTDGGDPDAQSGLAGTPPRYTAVRTADYTYVRYSTGEHEFYDRRTDPNQLDNVYGQLSPGVDAKLNAAATALSTCSGRGCRKVSAPVVVGASGAH